MRFHVRSLGLVPLLALAAALLWQATISSAAPLARLLPQPDTAQLAPGGQRPSPVTTMVTIFDNNAPTPPAVDPQQAFWGFGPHTILVRQGDTIVFTNPSTNFHPHTVTSLERIGGPFPTPPCPTGEQLPCHTVVATGTRFDSSPTQDALLTPGRPFTLDTSSLPPGNYPYFCKLHPWMVAELTVTGRGPSS
jgi:plastocyanin